MKYIFSMILILSLIKIGNAQTDLKIGMSLDEVQKIYPGLKASTYENQVILSKPDTIHGLESEWGFRFEKKILDWIYFHKYIDEIDSVNFYNCLDATRKIISDFTAVYGEPDETLTGNTEFVDPYVERHWGYDVLEARWTNYKGMKIKVRFNFMGGKGEYHFIVGITYFDKSYPYFD